MKPIKKFEDFLLESYNNAKREEPTNSIIEEIESIHLDVDIQMMLESEDSNEDPLDSLSLEELEKMCEDAYIREFADLNEDDDDDDIAAAKKDAKKWQNTADKATDNVGVVAAAVLGTMLLGPFGALAGFAIPLQNMIQKKSAIKKALKNLPEGKKKEALRKKLKGLTKAELEIYNKRAEERGKIAGINAAKKGETAPPKDASPEKKKGFDAGLKMAAAAKEKAKKIEELPKDEKSGIMKKLEDKKAEIDSVKAKDKEAMAKVEDIKAKAAKK